MVLNKQRIIEYYDSCEIDYKKFWDLNKGLAIHYGYWDETTKTFRQSLQRFNEILSEKAEIKKSDKILDAGCGVGGGSIFLAKKFGCRVTGITICKKQVKAAKINAENNNVADLVDFYEMDYMNTKFDDFSFDVVWALESVCYSDKKRFIKEAFRILKKGGRLIIADGFASKSNYNNKESFLMRKWL